LRKLHPLLGSTLARFAIILASLTVACGGGASKPETQRFFEVTQFSPTEGAERVALRRGVVLVFSEPVDKETLTRESVKVIAESGKEILGDREVGKLTPTLMTFTPREDFVPEELHTIHVTTAVRDTEGNALAAAIESTFTTEPAPPDMPTQALVEDLRAELKGGRWFHRTTLLPDNRFLIAGGYRASGTVQALVEILDPFTEQASIQTAGLLQDRAAHIQVLLDDGTVLIAGGESFDFPFTPLQSAERWDYRAGKSTIAASLNFARSFAEAIKLADGRVLVTGGQSLDEGSFIFRDDAEVYDPTLNTWTVLSGMSSRGLSGHGAWELSDGRVLLLGGSRSTPSAELLDVSSGLFTPTTSFPPSAHLFGATARLADGRPIYVGGVDTKSTTLFDEQFGFLSTHNSQIAERAFSTATALPDGRVLIIGGTDFSKTPSLLHTTIDMYAPEGLTGRIFRVPNLTLPKPTSHHTAALDSRGDLWLVGGLPLDTSLGGLRQVTVIRLSQE
jgi:hypothetical protein